MKNMENINMTEEEINKILEDDEVFKIKERDIDEMSEEERDIYFSFGIMCDAIYFLGIIEDPLMSIGIINSLMTSNIREDYKEDLRELKKVLLTELGEDFMPIPDLDDQFLPVMKDFGEKDTISIVIASMVLEIMATDHIFFAHTLLSTAWLPSPEVYDIILQVLRSPKGAGLKDDLKMLLGFLSALYLDLEDKNNIHFESIVVSRKDKKK